MADPIQFGRRVVVPPSPAGVTATVNPVLGAPPPAAAAPIGPQPAYAPPQGPGLGNAGSAAAADARAAMGAAQAASAPASDAAGFLARARQIAGSVVGAGRGVLGATAEQLPVAAATGTLLSALGQGAANINGGGPRANAVHEAWQPTVDAADATGQNGPAAFARVGRYVAERPAVVADAFTPAANYATDLTHSLSAALPWIFGGGGAAGGAGSAAAAGGGGGGGGGGGTKPAATHQGASTSTTKTTTPTAAQPTGPSIHWDDIPDVSFHQLKSLVPLFQKPYAPAQLAGVAYVNSAQQAYDAAVQSGDATAIATRYQELQNARLAIAQSSSAGLQRVLSPQ